MRATTTTKQTEEWVPTGRRLILIDIENVVGGSDATIEQVDEAMTSISHIVQPSVHDVVITACGSCLLRAATPALGRSVRLGRGTDGADTRLLETMAPGDVRGRYSSVVLVSGDSAAFGSAVERLAKVGVPTDVVVGAGRIGADLYKAARSVLWLSAPPTHQPPSSCLAP